MPNVWIRECEAHGWLGGAYRRPYPGYSIAREPCGRALYRRPPGVDSGRWVCYGNLVWVRLGSCESWPDEDMDAKMIDPVEPQLATLE